MITLPRPTREVVHQPTREVVPRHRLGFMPRVALRAWSSSGCWIPVADATRRYAG
jgi:hypothetical protein